MQLLPEHTGRVPQGQILYKGENLLGKSRAAMRHIRGAKISMIFQDPMTALDPIMPVGHQILESLRIHNPEHKSVEELQKQVDDMLTLVGIPPRRKGEYPHQFSGGMKQRSVIAVALACNPELLIADEPTTALDVTIQAQVLALMRDLKTRFDTSIIMITHDLGVVANTCDKVYIMYAGKIAEKGTVAEIFDGDRHHPYTVGLFGSVPNLDVETERLSPIDGLMPDPANLPAGCAFHPRCPRCMDICKVEEPAVSAWGEHTIACHAVARDFAERGE
jgi:peptide/nickel transport system ATP-binding protein